MVRNVVTVLIGLTALLALPLAGGAGGWYGGFHLIGVPVGAHCGLGALPAIFVGGFCALLGFVVGGVCGLVTFEAMLERL